MDIDLDLLCSICDKYSATNVSRLYMLDNIPQKKLKNAIQHFPLVGIKRTFMLYDCTVLGNCKTGIAVCDNGVFYKNDWTINPRYKYFTWDEISKLKVYVKKNFIFFGDKNKVFLPNDGNITSNILEDIFKKIQQSLYYENNQTINIAKSIEYKSKLSKTTVWMIAVDGKQYGPMDEEEIEKKLVDKFFIPEFTLVWKQGMDNWDIISNVREFKCILQNVNLNIIPPPIPDISGTKITKNNEKIDINNCELEELLAFDCISLQMANHLIEKRRCGKIFYNVDDIRIILDLKPHEIEEIKDKFIFNLSKTSKGVRKVEF